VNATPNYDSSVIAYNKLVMRPGISRHTITFLSFFKARSLQHSNISSKATHDEYPPFANAAAKSAVRCHLPKSACRVG